MAKVTPIYSPVLLTFFDEEYKKNGKQNYKRV